LATQARAIDKERGRWRLIAPLHSFFNVSNSRDGQPDRYRAKKLRYRDRERQTITEIDRQTDIAQ
jgi:hypothetical protein